MTGLRFGAVMSTYRKIGGKKVDIMQEADRITKITVDFTDQQERMKDATCEEIYGPIGEVEHMLTCLGFTTKQVSDSKLVIVGCAGTLRVMEIMANQSPDIRWEE